MKILCTRRDDIIKQRDEYDAARKQYDDAVNKAHNAYKTAVDDVLNPIADIFVERLSKYDALEFDVRVEEGFKDQTFVVRIRCNDHKVHSDDSALSWNWDTEVNLQTGEVKSETGSWSGLKATTSEQIKSLEQSVAALKELQGIDWDRLTGRMLPHYSTYYKDVPKGPGTRPNFDRMLEEADIEEYVNKPVLVKGNNGSGRYFRGSVYYHILKETPSMYEVAEVSEYKVNGDDWKSAANVADDNYTYRVKKDNFFDAIVRHPLEVINY